MPYNAKRLHTGTVSTQLPHPLSLSEALGRLRTSISDSYHSFIIDDISLLDGALVNVERLSGHRQLSDVYLLALAVAHDARLITLDTRIPLGAAIGANEDHLVII